MTIDPIKEEPEFSGLRAFLLPIHNHELKKFLPMSFMFFFVLFIYTILRDAKDTLVATAPAGGPEVLSFLKGMVVLPVSVFLVLVYTKLSNSMSRDKLFTGILCIIISYFALFAFVLLPNQDYFHPSYDRLIALQAAYPAFKYIFAIWGYWTYSLFYLFAELWSSFMLSLMFWQFANEITRTNEAKRFYALFGFIATISVFIAGGTTFYLSYFRGIDPSDPVVWTQTVQYLILSTIVAGAMVLYIYRWIHNNVLTDPLYYDRANAVIQHKEKKPRLSFKESLSYLFHSKYLGLIAVLVIAYGVSFGLTEVMWKFKVKQLFPSPNNYNAFMGVLSMVTSLVNILLVLFFKGIITRFGWYAGAIFTPLVLLATGILFFIFFFTESSLGPLAISLGTTPLIIVVGIGMLQNVLTKAAKYALFDPTKEMAYIPLDRELKIKGKAAVDVIGGRLGKGTSGAMTASLLMITAGSIGTIAPVIVGVIIVLALVWLYAVGGLSKLYKVALHDRATRKKHSP
jgi:AAA family ATP:ADP antiporter